MAKSRTELTIDVLGPIITAIGLVVTVVLFNKEQKQISERELSAQIQQEMLYSMRTDWEKQKAVYSRLSEAAGQISSELYRTKVYSDGTFEDFYDLFFGSMVLVEDGQVRDAVNLLHLDIKRLKEGKKSVLQHEPPIVQVIRSANFVIETLRTSSDKYRDEISIYQQHLLDETTD